MQTPPFKNQGGGRDPHPTPMIEATGYNTTYKTLMFSGHNTPPPLVNGIDTICSYENLG